MCSCTATALGPSPADHLCNAGPQQRTQLHPSLLPAFAASISLMRPQIRMVPVPWCRPTASLLKTPAGPPKGAVPDSPDKAQVLSQCPHSVELLFTTSRLTVIPPLPGARLRARMAMSKLPQILQRLNMPDAGA